jgi:hypothetical protein
MIFLCSCKKTERLELERFSLIGFTWRFINSNDTVPTLWIIEYIEINNKDSNYSYLNYPQKTKTFYQVHINDQLVDMINHNFLNVQMDTIGKPVEGVIYDGLMYCYCIKEKLRPEKFYYYNPYQLPDKWEGVYDKLDSIMKYDITNKISPPKEFQLRINNISGRLDFQRIRIREKIIKHNVKFVRPIIRPEN